jgi:hypothetical protein
MCSRPLRPLGFAHDHSHCPVLAPGTLAALPSTRAIETRLLPSSLAAIRRGFAFYVAFPKRSIPHSRRVLCRSRPRGSVHSLLRSQLRGMVLPNTPPAEMAGIHAALVAGLENGTLR